MIKPVSAIGVASSGIVKQPLVVKSGIYRANLKKELIDVNARINDGISINILKNGGDKKEGKKSVSPIVSMLNEIKAIFVRKAQH